MATGVREGTARGGEGTMPGRSEPPTPLQHHTPPTWFSLLLHRSRRGGGECNIPAQGLTRLIGYSYQQVTTLFPEAQL